MENLEKMDCFFNKRADNYEEHMKNNVTAYDELYNKLPKLIEKTDKKIKILDLGCGTGLELEGIFSQAPNAEITAIDLSKEMTNKLKEKFENKKNQINIIIDSYLTNHFEENKYDYIVSVMSLHHLIFEKRVELYKKIKISLKQKGSFIEGDFVVSRQKEKEMLDNYQNFINLIENYTEGEYHIDIPLSLENQKKLIKKSGFKNFNLVYEKENAIIYIAD